MSQARQIKSRAFNQREIIYLLAGLALVALDNILKWLANDGVRWPDQDAWFEFGLYPNPDFLGSIELPSQVIMIISGVALLSVMAFTIYCLTRRLPQMVIGGSWIILGGLSNFIDRLRWDWVVDYIGFDYGIPVFNLADLMVMIGVVYVIKSAIMKPEPAE